MDTSTQAPATAEPKKAAPLVNTVKMDDGRSVDFPGTRRLQKTVSILGDAVSVRLDFSNGETRTHKLLADLLFKAAGHGLSQKLGDEISGTKDLDDAITGIDELMARLDKGEWNESSTGGDSLAGASVLMKALIEVSGKTKDEVRAFLGGLSPKQKAALREDASIRPVVQRLEAEKAAAKAKKPDTAPKIDTASLMGQLTSGAKPATSAFTQGGQAQAAQPQQAQAGDKAATPQAPAAAPKAAVVSGNPADGKVAKTPAPQKDEVKGPKTAGGKPAAK